MLSACSESVNIEQKNNKLPAAPTPANTPSFNSTLSSIGSASELSHLMNKMSTSTKKNNVEEDANVMSNNPLILEALQGKLDKLVGQSSGYIESLPVPVQSRIIFLEKLQAEYSDLQAKFRVELLELEKKYLTLSQPLFEKRANVICGKCEPPGDSAVDSGEKQNADAGAVKGIPEFWLTAFKNSFVLEPIIQEYDEEPLKSLVDICLEYLNDNSGFKLIFKFEPNDYFTNTVLTKTYFLQDGSESGFDDLVFDHAVGDEISWKDNKNLTVKVETRKQKHKNSNKTRIVKRTIPQDSFFNFFKAPALDDYDEDDMDTYEEMSQSDYEIGEHFKETIIPHAVRWFTGEIVQKEDMSEDFEHDEDEDFDSEDEGDEQSASEESADDKPQNNQECKQQ